MTLEQAMAGFLADTQPGPSVQAAFRCSWPKFTSFCRAQGRSELGQVTAADLADFQQSLLWEPGPHGHLYSPNSVDQFLRRVRQLLRWAHCGGHIERDPSRELLLSRALQPARKLLRWEEFQSVLAAFDQSRPQGLRDAALFWLVTETALGLVQCLDLVVGQEQLLELEQPTRALLTAYLEEARPLFLKDPEEKALFPSRQGGSLGRQAAFLRLQHAARIAGMIGPVLPKTLRRSYLAHLERQAHNRHFSFNRTL